MAMIKGKMSRTKRLERIRDDLSRQQDVSIENLADKFGVTIMTIHRDLDFLESNGEIIKTHGGATMAKRFTFEFAFRGQQNKHHDCKKAIAVRAIKEVKDGDIIMLDTGTTTLEVARFLKVKKAITIITTSLAIVSELQFAEGIQVVFLGGYLRSGSPDMHGPLTEDNIEKFRADIAFVGADGVDREANTFTDNLEVANLSKRMAKNSSKVVVVSDSSKVCRESMVKVLSGADYDMLITDSGVGVKNLDRLKKKVDVEVVHCKQ